MEKDKNYFTIVFFGAIALIVIMLITTIINIYELSINFKSENVNNQIVKNSSVQNSINVAGDE